MNYFTAGIYGDIKRYRKIKETLLKKEEDNLWILGDVMDGNSKNPEACFEILSDIFSSKNIHLILGDHDYLYTLYIMALLNEDLDESEYFKNELERLEISTKPLLDHISKGYDREKLKRIAKGLSDCDATDLVQIGDVWFYLCHGAPALCPRSESPEDYFIWQNNVVFGALDMERGYVKEIFSDPNIQDKLSMLKNTSPGKIVIICGGAFVSNLVNNGEQEKDGLIYKDRKFILNEGICGDDNDKGPFSVLGIDAAGFFIRKIEVTR